MKTPSNTLGLGSILLCCFILQGCSTDSTNPYSTTTYPSGSVYANPPYNSVRENYNNLPHNREHYYNYNAIPDSRDMPPTEYTRQSSQSDRNIKYDNAQYTVEYYDNKDVPVAAKSSDYTNSATKPAAKKLGDMEWVKSQQPGMYTIEMSNDPKRSKVAYQLYKTPKSQRTVQFGYQNQQQKLYTGVYGTYKTKEEAQQALNSLPPDVKPSASVQQWQQVQSKATKHVTEEKPNVEAPQITAPASGGE